MRSLLLVFLVLAVVPAGMAPAQADTPETGQPDPFHYYKQAEYQLRSAYFLLEPNFDNAEAGDHRDNKYQDIQSYRKKVEITDDNVPPDTTREVIVRQILAEVYNDLLKNVVDENRKIQFQPAIQRPANYIRRLQRVLEIIDDTKRYIRRGVHDLDNTRYEGVRQRSFARLDEAARVVNIALGNALDAAQVGGSVAQQERDRAENAQDHDKIPTGNGPNPDTGLSVTQSQSHANAPADLSP